MAAPRWKLALAPLAPLVVATPLLVNCGKPPPTVSVPPTAAPHVIETCDELVNDKFGEVPMSAPPEAQARIRTLFTEARRLIGNSVAVETELMEACRALGKGAGAFDEELKGKPDRGKGAEKVCAIAVAKAQKILDDAKSAKIKIQIEFDKPLCFVDVGTIKQCIIDCGSKVLGDDKALCNGELYGTCKGRCGGACANDPGVGSGSCWGLCNGKCDKEFRGTCGGKCNGTCNGNPTRGPHRCVGICDGSCSDKSDGMCGGRCDGDCKGPWQPRDLGKCDGICTGQCMGQAGQPVCSGEYTPQGVDTTCLSTCTATAAVGVRCDAPMVHVTVKGGKHLVELQKLLAGMQSALPRILRITEGTTRRLPKATENISAGMIEWSNAFATAGAKPLACVRAGLDGMKAGSDAVEVAVKGAEAYKPLIAPFLKPADPPPGPPPEQ